MIEWLIMRSEMRTNDIGRVSGSEGFSLVSTMVAVGMMGLLSLALSQLTRQQVGIQKKVETYFEINNLSNKILRGLYDGDGCMETFGINSDIIGGRTLSAIKNKNGEVVVDTVQKYGNRLIKVDSISIANVRINGTSGQMDLQVVFEKLNKSIRGYKKTTQSYPLSVQVDSLKRLTQCTYDYGGIYRVAAEGVCKSLTGVFDPVSLSCSLDGLVLNMQINSCQGLGSAFDNSTSRCIIDNVVKNVQKQSCASLGGVFDTAARKCTDIRR